MAIYRLLQQSAFGPEDIDVMVRAYDECLRLLNLADRSDPLTEIIARKIIEIAQTGVRNPKRIRQLTFDGLGLPAAE
jgi:predicted nucleotidyltransferase